MIYRKKNRLRRAKKYRFLCKNNLHYRLVIFKSLRYIYVQLISKDNCNVLVSASTLEKKIKSKLLNKTKNKIAANLIGRIIAKRCLKNNIINVIFDRSGYKYHGCVKELAESARNCGLLF